MAFARPSAGAADEAMFIKNFEEGIPRITFHSGRDVTNELTDIIAILSDTSRDWEKRAEQIRRVRSLIVSGCCAYDEFHHLMKQLELAFQVCLKDLRSKVVRETCITVSYLCTTMNNQWMDRMAEGLLPSLLLLIPNSAKIMSTSGIVCVRFIIRYTHAPRLIPVICSNMSSKAKEIRKATCEFLDQLLHTWVTHSLKNHVHLLSEAIRKGISDADPDARIFARRAFWGFHDHFKEQADSLIHTLDGPNQRRLHGEGSLSNSASTQSLSSSYQAVNGLTTATTITSTTSNSNHRGRDSSRGPPPTLSTGTSAYVTPGMHQHSMSRTQGAASVNRGSVSTSNSVENLSRPWSAMSSSRVIGHPRGSFQSPSSLLSGGPSSRIPVFSPKNQSPNSKECSPSPIPVKYGSAIDVAAARRARARAVINNGTLDKLMRFNQSSRSQSTFASNRSLPPPPPHPPSSPPPPLPPSVPPPVPDGRPSSPGSKIPSSSNTNIKFGSENSVPNNQYHQRRHSRGGEISGNGDEDLTLSTDHCLELLKPIIGEIPVSTPAIKMLTRLVEQQPKDTVTNLMPHMMPALVKAYDSPEISVRKASVFAMVAIHNVVGHDVLHPFLSHLNTSKVKLLNLYIERSKVLATSAASSVTPSPTSSSKIMTTTGKTPITPNGYNGKTPFTSLHPTHAMP